MKPLIIINPVAGNKKTELTWLQIKEILDQNGFEYDSVFTEHAKHATEIAKKEVKNGRDAFIAIGGDGTYSEVVNGIMSVKGDKEIQFGVIATGTGNDFIRSAKIPHDYEKACHMILDPHMTPLDIGKVTFRENGEEKHYYFLNSVGMGFDAEVIANVQKNSKRGGGTWPFVKSLLKVLPFYKPINMGLTIDKQKTKPLKIMTTVVANGAYFGGGMMIAPNADIRDTLFDVVVLNQISKLRLLKVFPRIYKGTHVKEPEIKQYLAKHVVLKGPDFATIQADGEVICHGPIEVDIIPGALKFMY